MNEIILYVALLISLPCLGDQSTSTLPEAKRAKYVYLEFHPNTAKPITIHAIKCKTEVNELKVQKFESKTKVANGTVNVLNIYVQAGDCKESPISSVWQETVHTPKNGKHTHVHITLLSENAMVL